MKTKLNLVYITAKDTKEAHKIGESLVKSRLAACVNIIDNMNSLYRWESRLQRDKEVVLIAKTTEGLVGKLIEKVKSMHSYKCPCVISLPISGGNKDYLEWLRKEVD